jgi:SAM-dependent methyltransferase
LLTRIDSKDVEWRSGSIDPMGRVFQYQGNIYRAIRQEKTDFVKSLFSSGIISLLVGKKLLIPTEMTSFTMPGYGLILRHKTIPFLTRSFYWPRVALLDAAKLIVRLNLQLLAFELGTIDFHSFNVALGADSRPQWIDFGSIIPVNLLENVTVPDEFLEYFINPLLLYTRNADVGFACRQLLQQEKIPTKDLFALTGMRFTLPPPGPRKAWLMSLMQWLENVRLPNRDSEWGDYYMTDAGFNILSKDAVHAPDSRMGVVQSIVRKHRPRKVIDIGCNAGHFSCLAAYEGAEVHALDYDENAIELFYHTLQVENQQLPITLSIRDVTNWHPQYLFPCVADMVFALALTHHLSLGQNLSFERIAWLLSQYASSTLITDFMPRGLGVDRIHPDPLPSFYTLENFMDALRPYFNSVRSIELVNTVGHRIIVCCEGRNKITAAGL